MSFLNTDIERAALRAMPLDSAFRGVPIDRVIKRLQEERGLVDGGHLTGDHELAVVILVENDDDEALRASIESVALQSVGAVRCILVAPDAERVSRLERLITRLKLKPKDLQLWPSFDLAQRKSLQKQRMVTFLRHGDRLNPSTAAALAIARRRGEAPSVVCWGELQPSVDGAKLLWAQRNPPLNQRALQHWPYLRNAFAVESKRVIQYPGDLVREAVRNHLHLFQIWLSQKADVTWGHLAEPFLVRANHRASESLDRIARAAFSDYADAYSHAFPGFDLKLQPAEVPAPYRLRPREAPAVVSVIIPFRDKPDLTIAAARSVFAQQFNGFLEVVLVDNQSNLDSLRNVNAALAPEMETGRCRVITYNKPFNHSDQCNKGVAASLGDVIVFLNNDAVLQMPEALEEMAAWAMAPGVGTVGLRMRNPETGHEAAGMSLRLQPTAHFDSIVEETCDAVLTPYMREVFGNTFACAAVSRAVFTDAGMLDTVAFPNGYNDVDFACRVNRMGLSSLSLGHFIATHAPGASRGRVDEGAQKVLLRSLYPETAALALSALRMDSVLLERAKPLPGAVARAMKPPPAAAQIDPSMQRRPFLKRVAGRIAETGPVQRALQNPTIYRLARKTYKFIVR